VTQEDPAAAIAQLLGASEPVSFYDVARVLRPFARVDPPDAILRRLLELHAAEHLTDGAREVLDGYLRACAARHAAERRLAASPLTARSHGRTARAAAGTSLTLRLDDRPKQGWRWELVACDGPLVCRRRPSAQAHDPAALFELQLSEAGRGQVSLAEQPSGETAAPGPKPRTFTLNVVIEPRR
jgi:hypothetical protein